MSKALIELDEEIVKILVEIPYKEFLKTTYWKELRKIVFKLIGSKECEVCGGIDRINVHHLHYETRGRETLDDLVCLCERCHAAIHCYNSQSLNACILTRNSFKTLLETAQKISSKFSNKQYIKLLPLTKIGAFTVLEASKLWDISTDEAEQIIESGIKLKLIAKYILNGEVKKFYMNYFHWHYIELTYPILS